MADFFEHTCDACGTPFCERILVMNLALDITEEAFCLSCLAEQQGIDPKDFYEWILSYVMARDCFKSPWDKFSALACPRITDKSCFCPALSA